MFYLIKLEKRVVLHQSIMMRVKLQYPAGEEEPVVEEDEYVYVECKEFINSFQIVI